MTKPWKALLLCIVLAISLGASADYKPGEVIVKYKDGVVRARNDMNALYDSVGVESIGRYSHVMNNFEHLYVGENSDLKSVIKQLEKSFAVEYAQPNYILHSMPVEDAVAVRDMGLEAEKTPCWMPGVMFPPGCISDGLGFQAFQKTKGDRPALQDPPAEVNPPILDPQIKTSYGLAKIGATKVWPDFNGDKEFIVADIDTGIDYNHEDLSFNLWRNENPSQKNDIVGYNFIFDDGLPFDDNGHGSHTGGTIGAVGGNGVGTSGVIQRVSLMALKFLDAEGSGTTTDAIRAIDYAINHGARVLSNSWGGRGDPDNQALKDAITRAMKKNVLFIAAAGNDGANNDGSDPSYPAAFTNDNLISVAATDERDSLASFSNYGKKTTHLGAPGVRVYSTVPGNGYEKLSGTSMACPHVAGAAALLWARHPDWTYKKVKRALLESVDPVRSLKNKTVSGGRLNIAKALSNNE